MADKILKFIVNAAGRKIKTDGLTINQNSSNNELQFVTPERFECVEVFFAKPDGTVTPKYHLTNSGAYQKTAEDLVDPLMTNIDFYVWKLRIPFGVTSFTITGSSARIESSFAGYKYNNQQRLIVTSISNTQVTVNKSTTSATMDEVVPAEVENIWKTIGELKYTLDNLEEGELTNYYTKAQVDALLANKADKSNTYTKSETNAAIAAHHDSQKQDVISDLNTIRSGAALGATAVQPAAITDMATKTWVGNQGYLTEHQSLANYSTTAQMNTAIANHHDTTKQDKLIAGNNITIAADGKTISATSNVRFEVVQTLPATGESGVIYLVPKQTTEQGDVYDEYIYVNNAWEKIGSTAIDLSQVPNKIDYDGGFKLYHNNTLISQSAPCTLKTINGNNIVGSGNITVSVTVDDTMSSTSENPVQNKVVNAAINNKVSKLSGTSTYDKLYKHNADGTEGNIDMTASNVSGTVVVRDLDGRANIATPASTANIANKGYVDTQVATKSNVSVSGSGSSTTEVKYITIDGVERKLPDGEVYTAGTGIDITDNVISVGNTIATKTYADNAANTVKSEIVDNAGTDYNTLSKLQTKIGQKQNTLTAGAGINIVSDVISCTAGLSIQIVQTLPATGVANVIYLVPAAQSTTGNVYDEYIWINNTWEKIGSTAIDLSNYYTKTQTDSAIAAHHDSTKQDVLTAGSNITINNNVISATDTTYSAGTGISISAQNAISNTGVLSVNGNAGAITGIATSTDLQQGLATKITSGSISASSTGTSSTEVQYITIEGTEYKLAGGGAEIPVIRF